MMNKKKPLSPEHKAECDALNKIWLSRKNRLGVTLRTVGELADISDPAVSHYLKGINPLNAQIASVFSRVLQVPVTDFSPRLEREISKLTASNTHNIHNLPVKRESTDTIEIPRLDVYAAMGSGLARPDDYVDVIERMTVNRDWLRRNVSASAPGNLAVITGLGDSMEGTFNDGDLLLVDRGITEIKVDAVYVLALNDELYIKRLQRRPGGTLLMLSDNPKYETYEIKNGDLSTFQVLGRVLLAWNARRL